MSKPEQPDDDFDISQVKPEDRLAFGLGIPNDRGIVFTTLFEMANWPEDPKYPVELQWLPIEEWPDRPIEDPEKNP